MTTRVLIMAGGTGGHVIPALAVAEQLRARGIEVSWLGTERGIEARLVPAANIPLNSMHVQGLRGNGLIGWLLAPLRLLKALREAAGVINRFKPDVVMGMGGFASGPGGVAARLKGVPLLIHEQNAIPGLTNKLLSKIADRVLQAFPNSFNNHAVLTVGNPVRESIEALEAPQQRFTSREGRVRLLILGGSLGARSLNQHLPAALALMNKAIRPEVMHQCGQRHLEDCKRNYQQAGVEATVTDFIDDMAATYEWADLIVCRAGALTVSEVAAAGVAAIFVPFPYAVDDHQTANAQCLVNANAAKLIADKDLSAATLAIVLTDLLDNRDRLVAMATAARGVAQLGAAKIIADHCMELAHG